MLHHFGCCADASARHPICMTMPQRVAIALRPNRLIGDSANCCHSLTAGLDHHDCPEKPVFVYRAWRKNAEARALSADVARGNGRTRLGFMRCDPGDRRRVYRSSELRHGAGRPLARSTRFPGGHHQPAGLAFGRAVPCAGQAESVFRRDRRQYGFDGEPLYRRPQAAFRRCVHAERRTEQAAGSCSGGVCAAGARSVSGHSGRNRQHRSQSAPHCTLRLLVRYREAFGVDGFESGHPVVRQCRARAGRTDASHGSRRIGEDDPRLARHRVHGAARLAAGRRLDRSQFNACRYTGTGRAASRSL